MFIHVPTPLRLGGPVPAGHVGLHHGTDLRVRHDGSGGAVRFHDYGASRARQTDLHHDEATLGHLQHVKADLKVSFRVEIL